MIGFEVWLNGSKVGTIAAGDRGVLTAIVSSVASRQELALELGGLQEGAHLSWASPRDLRVGDQVSVTVIETEHADEPTRFYRDDPALVEASERKTYARLKAKYGQEQVGDLASPQNNALQLTKPAQAMELRS